MKKAQTPGFTFYISAGKYGGFGIRWDMGIRIVLGWVSIALLYVDLERAAGELLQAAQMYRNKYHELLEEVRP